MAVLTSIAVDQPAPVASINSEAGLSDLVGRLLRKDAADRPSSAREVAAELLNLERAAVARDGASEAEASAGESRVRPAASGGRRWIRPIAAAAIALLALVPLGWLYGGTVIRYATNQGELVIEVDDEQVEVRITQSGVVVQDTTSKCEFTLTAGKGEIEVYERDGVGPLTTRQFTLNRGGKTTVRVTAVELAAARKPEPAPPPREGESPDRRAAEYVLSVGGYVKTDGLQESLFSASNLPAGPFRLTGVHLENRSQVSDADLAVFRECTELTELNLINTPITDARLTWFKDSRKLRHLRVSGTPLTDAGLAFFKDCTDLRLLWLIHVPVSDAGVAHFKDCRRIDHLWLSGTSVTDSGLATFKDCEDLQSVTLSSPLISDAGIAHLRGCPNITSLHLECPRITDASLAVFKNLRELQSLELARTPVTDAGMVHLKDWPGLTILDLDQTAVTDAGLVHAVHCKNLEHVRLNGTRVSDGSLEALRECKQLKSLDLIGTDVTDAGLAHLGGHASLVLLYLTNTIVSDAGLAHLKNCRAIQRLHLEGTKVTDAGLIHLRDLANLTEVILYSTRVSDAGIDVFLHFPRLTVLNLDNTRVSHNGFQQLKAAMPAVNITWAEPNRAAAEHVLALGETVEIGTPGSDPTVAVASADAQPREFFQLRRIVLKGVKAPLDALRSNWSALIFPEFDRLESIDFTDTALPYELHLAPIESLHELNLTRTGINGAQVGTLPKFERLVLDENGIGASGLESLNELTGLVELSAAGAGLTDEDLAKLPPLPKLERLVLDENPIRGPGLASLANLPQLVDLSVGIPTLADLAMPHVGRLERLRRLSLAKAAVTDDGLRRLEKLVNLERLDLRGTQVSAEGINALRSALSNCRIEWDSGVVEPKPADGGN